MKQTTVALTLFLLIISARAGTLRDNFDDGNFLGWKLLGIPGRSQWFVKNGELVCISDPRKVVDDCKGTDLGIGDETWKDYEFSIQFKIEHTFRGRCRGLPYAAVGVNVRRHGPAIGRKHWVGIALGPQAIGVDWLWVSCQRWVLGTIRDIRNQPFFVRSGEWHTMRAVVNGKRHQMFIDDTKICDLQGDLPNKGIVDLWVRSREVHFDNVVITGNEIPDKNLAVSPKAKLTTTWGQIKDF